MKQTSRNATDLKILRASMVNYLRNTVGITDPQVLDAMNTVKRHAFVENAFRYHAYEDHPLPIGHGQTISQPSTVALMTELLDVQKGMRVLEIGTGSGYQAAILAHMGCRVFTIERIPELFKSTRILLNETLGLHNVYMTRGDGTYGLQQAAPFDRILVTAGGPEIPKPLIRQLDNNGIMLIPVGEQKRAQRLMRVRKENNMVYVADMGSAIFVDLVGNHGW